MASIGVLDPMSMNAVIAVMPVMPSATPNSAVMIGMPAPTSEPKVRISTISATPTPSSSEVPPGCSMFCMPAPLASTERPLSRASAMMSRIASWVAGSTSIGVSTSKFQVMVPTRPSSDSGRIALALAMASARGVPFCCASARSRVPSRFAVSTGFSGPPSPGICGAWFRSATSSSTAWR